MNLFYYKTYICVCVCVYIYIYIYNNEAHSPVKVTILWIIQIPKLKINEQ